MRLLLALSAVLLLAACSLERPPDDAVTAEGEAVVSTDASSLPGAVRAGDSTGARAPGGTPVTDPRAGRSEGSVGPESFAGFFDVFRDDTTFQRTRIAPSFVASSPNPMGDGTVEGRTYIPHALRFDGGESIRESFVVGGTSLASAADVPAGARTVEFRLDGTDNGIAIGYRFARDADGRWRLAGLDDASM